MDNQLYYESQVREVPEPAAKNDALKVIAIFSMLVDHIGYGLFPDFIFLRIIGRLAFPIFAHSITVGYTNTRNLKRYMLRLLAFGAISQIPFSIFSPGRLNIMFTLLVGLCCIYSIDKKRYLYLALLVIMGVIIPMDYGLYGVAVIVLFYIYRSNLRLTAVSHVIVTFLYCLLCNSFIQMFCVLSLFFILREWKTKIALNKYFFYVFYPAHIAVILLAARAF